MPLAEHDNYAVHRRGTAQVSIHVPLAEHDGIKDHGYSKD